MTQSEHPATSAAISAASLVTVPPTVPVCGMRKASDVEQYTGTALPTTAYVNALTPDGSGQISSYRYWPGTASVAPRWYVSQSSDSSTMAFRVYDAANNSLVTSFTVSPPSGERGRLVKSFGVDPASGDVYVGTYAPPTAPGLVSRWTVAGTEVWHLPTTGLVIGAVYGYADASGAFRVGAVVDAGGNRSQSYSNTFTSSGSAMPNNVVVGDDVRVATAHQRDLVSSSNGGIRVYASDGATQQFAMTSSGLAGGGSWNFGIDGANELADGTIVADSYNTKSMAFFDPTGVLLGTIGTDAGGGDPLDDVISSSPIEVVNNRIYYAAEHPFSAPNKLTYVTVPNAQLLYRAPQGAPYHLGLGAQLQSPANGNFFVSGSIPKVQLQFSQWWQKVAGAYSGQYSVRSIGQIKVKQVVAPIAFSIPSSSTAYIGGVANVSLTLPANRPGYYEVDAKLLKNGVVVGADCLRYSVGATGNTLDLASLPSTADAHAVAVAAEFGQKLVRSSYRIDDCLPGISTTTSTTRLACPPTMDQDVNAAAALAAQRGLVYEIQLADGSGLDKSIVSSGQWQRLSQAFAGHYPTVRAFEGWNEVNNTYSSDSPTVVRDIFKPFFAGIRAGNPSATVVGGSVIDVSVGFWQGVASAGGLGYMDVIGDHPYTGHNRSFEEQGQLSQLMALKSVLASNGYAAMPIWTTESGWWNTGTNSFYTQGDKLIRSLVLDASIGITKVYNFVNVDSYQIDGVVWGLIDSTGLNSAGLASVNYKRVLGGRAFARWLPTGIPHTYAAEYGSSSTSSQHVVVVWSDDVSVAAKVGLSSGGSMVIQDQYGAASTVHSGTVITLAGSVHYLAVPAGSNAQITPNEVFGTNYASSTQGATATSSSSLDCGGGTVLTSSRTLDSISTTEGRGNLCDGGGMSAWSPTTSDPNPTLTITLPNSKSIDRLYVSGQGSGSIETGLRSFTVQIDDGSGVFSFVARVSDQFFRRNILVSFSARTTKRIRLTAITVNASGYGDGNPPTFWGPGFPELSAIYAVEAYEKGVSPAT